MNHYDVVIFGAGLAGLSAANHLLKSGNRILLVDPQTGPLGTDFPGGLVNPATGKRATPGWRGLLCYKALRSHIETLSNLSSDPLLFMDSGVLRPALTEKLAENFANSLQANDWPDGWLQWIDADQIARDYPDIAPTHGGLMVQAGYTVYVNRYLATYRNWLRERGARLLQAHATYEPPTPSRPSFAIRSDDETLCTSDQVLVAAGVNSVEFPGWETLKIHPVKGQMVLYDSPKPLPWNCAVSAKGYSLRIGQKQLLAGSTYEHHFDDLELTDEAFERVTSYLKQTFPHRAETLNRTGQFCGVRVTTPNRLPVIGEHPAQKRLFIYSGMNSKGLLFSEYTGQLLAQHIIRGESIPEELTVSRLL